MYCFLDNQDLKTPTLPQAKASIFYKSCLNITDRNRVGKSTLKTFVKQITRHENYEKNLISLITTGIASRMISINSFQNPKNPKYNILQVKILYSSNI